MSYEVPGFMRSYEPAADLSTQYLHFVKLSGTTIAAVAAATDKCVGVLQNKPAPGSLNVPNSSGTVMVSGTSRVMAGKALAAGTPVYLDAVGRVTDVAQAGQCVGVTEEAATAADVPVAVLLKPLGSVI